MIDDFSDIQRIISSIRTLTCDFSKNLPHSLDLHQYLLTLMKIRSALPEVNNARNKSAVNIEAELKLFVPVYIHYIDEIPEEQIVSLVDECERSLYFNFELIRAIKETVKKRKHNDMAAVASSSS